MSVVACLRHPPGYTGIEPSWLASRQLRAAYTCLYFPGTCWYHSTLWVVCPLGTSTLPYRYLYGYGTCGTYCCELPSLCSIPYVPAIPSLCPGHGAWFSRHLLNDTGTSACTPPDDQYSQDTRGDAGTTSATDRYQCDAHGDRYRDRGDADWYSPGTCSEPPPRKQQQCADRHSPGAERAPPTDQPEVTQGDRKQRRRRRGGRAFSPRPCRLCGGGYVFDSLSGLQRHVATTHHMYFRRPDAYVPIPPDQLDAVLRSIC